MMTNQQKSGRAATYPFGILELGSRQLTHGVPKHGVSLCGETVDLTEE
jgi:hypothetical protein